MKINLFFTALIFLAALGGCTTLQGETLVKNQLVGPFSHENIELYLITAAVETDKPKDLSIITLEEGLKSGKVVVRETGTVSQLAIENFSNAHLYIHAGDIVKGGKQDRLLPNGLTLAPQSKVSNIAAFCVEQNRWAQRGNENVFRFSSSKNIINSVRLKQAAQVSKSQGAVWGTVKQIQDKAAQNAGTNVQSSSLQLTLESPTYQKAISEYTKALSAQIPQEQLKKAVGFTYALNGKFHSSDQFMNEELFNKMWPKLLEAATAEAITEFDKEKESAPLAKNDYITAIQKGSEGEAKTEKVGIDNEVSTRIHKDKVSIATSGKVNGDSMILHKNTAIKTDYDAIPEMPAAGLSLQLVF